MKIIVQKQSFPLAIFKMDSSERVKIQRSSMVFHDNSVELKTRVNGRGHGLGKMLGAVGRSLTSRESMLITEAYANDNGRLGIAPSMPGNINQLELGDDQYYLNDGVFLAMTSSANYKMHRQKLGKALFGGTGGLFIMETTGVGQVLVSSFGAIERLHVDGNEVSIDNSHVVAWSTNLDYRLHFDNGLLQSMGTGEGLINSFSGVGDVYIQTLNLPTFVQQIQPYIQASHTSINIGGDDDDD